MTRDVSPSVLSVRVNAEERALLEAAAEQAQTSLSDFIRRKALDAAEIDVLSRSTVIIPAGDWETFESWIDRPAAVVPGLERLAAVDPSWEAE